MEGPFTSLLCHDAEPECPILTLGASSHSEEEHIPESDNCYFTKYPFSSKHIYHSQASLEGLRGVECFLDEASIDGPASCVGVILEYGNERRAALGECRVGVSKSICLIAPTILLLKPANDKSVYSRAWFTSSEEEAIARQNLGWERRCVDGNLVWWFGWNIIEIVHS